MEKLNLNGADRDKNILDPYSFDILLLEISCNLREINKAEIKKHFLAELERKAQDAKEYFNEHQDEILENALEYRNMQ